MRAVRSLAHFVVRLASRLAPPDQRARMIREWDAELEREFGAGSSWAAAAAAFGAFADARALADVKRQRERGREGRMGGMRTNLDEIRQAARGLRRAPGFTGVAVATLAIGIGGSAAVYTLLDRVVLDPLPFPEAERITHIANQVPGIDPDAVWALSTAQYVFYEDNATTLEEVGLYSSFGGNVTSGGSGTRVRAVRMTASAVRILGVEAELGRVLDEVDDRPDATLVTVISHDFWTRVMGADPNVVGTTVTFNDIPYEVIGVLARDTSLPGLARDRTPDLWVAFRVDRDGNFGNSHVYPALGLLAPGQTPEYVEAELERLEARLPEAFPNAYSPSFFEGTGFRTTATPLKEHILGDLASRLWLLLAGVGVVLMIAAANVANLFLVRMDGKRPELGVRRALGADRVAIGRYVFAEALVLATAGGVLAVVVGAWAIPALARTAPVGLPRVSGVEAGPGTVLFSLLLALLVGVAIAAYPALSSSADRTAGTLAGSSRGGTASRGRQRVRSALVVLQMGLAVSLLVGAGMLVQGIRTLQGIDPGFDPEGVFAMDLHASRARYPDDVALWSFHREIVSALSSIPGVTTVGMGEEIPVSGGYGCTVQGFEDRAVYARLSEAGLTTCAGQSRVTPGYFQALGIPLLEGRYLEEGDFDDPSRGAVVISRSLADRFWPDESPLGQAIGPNGRSEAPFFRIVGVVGDVKKRASDGRPPLAEDAPAIYYPGVYLPNESRNWGGWWPGSTTVLIRTDGTDAEALTESARRIVREIDPETPIANARSMEEVVAGAMASLAFLSILMAISAAIAMGLATIGLYGVVSYVVSQRRREIGMRLAIGAAPSTVVREIVSGTGRLVLAGLALGIPLAVVLTRLGRSALVGIEPTDPVAYGASAAIVASIGLLAGWLPARRAAAIDPVESLRAE